jgi:hypothetical protein
VITVFRLAPIVLAAAQVGGRYDSGVTGPHRFIVTWGRMGRFDFVAEVVEAWDPDDAMVTAADLHPELPRPRVAVLASQAGPLTFGRRSNEERVEPE